MHSVSKGSSALLDDDADDRVLRTRDRLWRDGLLHYVQLGLQGLHLDNKPRAGAFVAIKGVLSDMKRG